jgi:hypothetical protein
MTVISLVAGIHFSTERNFLCGRCEFSAKPSGFVSGWPCQLAYSGIVWTHPWSTEHGTQCMLNGFKDTCY